MNYTYGWSRFSLALSVLGVLTLFAPGCATTTKGSQTATPTQDLTDVSIERYIRAHPEVIEQSLLGLLAKREVELRDNKKTALATKQQDLLHDPTSPVSGNPKG
ncbi:MAG: hypothetical protein ACXW37_12860, partial [Nitrospira sp.]